MNYLKHDPYILRKKIDDPFRSYHYECFNILLQYNLPINIYYDYFLSIEQFKLKNLWNHMISRWNHMKLELKDDSSFKKSKYSEGDIYHQVHNNMNDIEMDKLLTHFIQQDKVKALFVVNCIQNYIFPI